MSGVINTVIDSWAFPGSIAFSRFKAVMKECTSTGAWSAFQTDCYRDAGRMAAVTRDLSVSIYCTAFLMEVAVLTSESLS